MAMNALAIVHKYPAGMTYWEFIEFQHAIRNQRFAMASGVIWKAQVRSMQVPSRIICGGKISSYSSAKMSLR